MKRDVLNIVALVAVVLVLAIGAPLLVQQIRSLPPRALAARGNEKVVTLEVGGMTCSGCAATVQASLAGTQGVSDVSVRFKQRLAYVVCAPTVSDTALIAAVQRAGPGFLAAVAAR